GLCAQSTITNGNPTHLPDVRGWIDNDPSPHARDTCQALCNKIPQCVGTGSYIFNQNPDGKDNNDRTFCELDLGSFVGLDISVLPSQFYMNWSGYPQDSTDTWELGTVHTGYTTGECWRKVMGYQYTASFTALGISGMKLSKRLTLVEGRYGDSASGSSISSVDYDAEAKLGSIVSKSDFTTASYVVPAFPLQSNTETVFDATTSWYSPSQSMSLNLYPNTGTSHASFAFFEFSFMLRSNYA
ncbi:unnamed protein product, partial [Amoebophrya sp. A120]